MKNLLLILFLWSSIAIAQTTKTTHPKGAIHCKTCHSCEYPTVKDPCLIDCPRADLITIRHSAEVGPDVIKMDFFKERYGPVLFSHRLHAQMFDMSGGCAGCHHYNTTGPILACSTCHETTEKKEDIGTPGLLAAYHRQCINCHREWSHESGCQSCHALKSKTADSSVKKTIASLKMKTHKTVAEPLKLIYEMDSDKGKLVTFYHKEHTQLFGQACVRCHAQENCVDCHDVDKGAEPRDVVIKPRKAGRTEDEKHEACYSCHKGDDCTLCHANVEKAPFDHGARSGWSLKVYHAGLSCKSCHPGNKFARSGHICISCHPPWNTANFKHRVVGLELDANHNSLDCEDCHINKQFEARSSCSNCHDDKAYPNDKPGKLIR